MWDVGHMIVFMILGSIQLQACEHKRLRWSVFFFLSNDKGGIKVFRIELKK